MERVSELAQCWLNRQPQAFSTASGVFILRCVVIVSTCRSQLKPGWDVLSAVDFTKVARHLIWSVMANLLNHIAKGAANSDEESRERKLGIAALEVLCALLRNNGIRVEPRSEVCRLGSVHEPQILRPSSPLLFLPRLTAHQCCSLDFAFQRDKRADGRISVEQTNSIKTLAPPDLMPHLLHEMYVPVDPTMLTHVLGTSPRFSR